MMPPFVSSIADSLLGSVLLNPYFLVWHKPLRPFDSYLGEIGLILLRTNPPWIKAQKFSVLSIMEWLIRDDRIAVEGPKDTLILGPDSAFGAFALFAAMLESAQRRKRFSELIRGIKMLRAPLFDYMRHIFIARYEQVDAAYLKAEIDHCGFTTEQQTFIWKWIRREVNVVSRGRSK